MIPESSHTCTFCLLSFSCEHARDPERHSCSISPHLRRSRSREGHKLGRVSSGREPPSLPLPASQHRQRSLDDVIVKYTYYILLSNAATDLDKTRLMSAKQPHAGDWLLAPSITADGLWMSEEIRLSAGLRFRARLCQSHTGDYGARVDTIGLHTAIHGISCRKSAGQ